MSNWLYLFVAVIFEVIATSSLKSSKGFTNLIPSIIVVLGYAGAFYFLSLTLMSIPIGVAYAVWSGFGIVLISLVGFFIFKQNLDLPAILGMSMIISGVLIVHIFSNSI
ncbi:QacE family quaternary ammonium compound efflux SMR transporter [Vibrio sp. S9_S30]|uniref:DMT family transporter n=1 Tax=Vibrio sp. S9_S30 TaxID=2720226 RepID=UPI001681B427|nr:SMR family transporter [Vibrio sp. S9_S30]MBD1556359.1 QacE family quaternary ammonium compound efflux SMR transporter [Vibrio sp. S9_S30]